MAAALCSAQAAEAGLPLIGSAGTHSAVIAIELASPWAAKLRGSPAADRDLDAALQRLDERCRGARLLFFDGDGRSEDGLHRVLVFERGGGPFRAFSRREITVPRDKLAEVLDALTLGAGGGGEAEQLAAAQPQGRDVFVCTHGSRDACCGKLGFPLYRELCERMSSPGIRLWRCSHLGGHRFAPTLLDLPSGRLYGRMRGEDAEWLLTHGAGADQILEHYRGLCVMPPAVQVLEREMWARRGPRWLDASLEWTCEERDDGVHVSLVARWRGGATLDCRGHAVESERDGLVVAESCGKEPKRQRPWKLVACSESAR